MEWISVKDLVPDCDVDGEFLAWDGEFIEYCCNWVCHNYENHYSGHDKIIECFTVMRTGTCRADFTHWMPLPQPSNGEK